MKFYEWVGKKQLEIEKAVLERYETQSAGSWEENTITASVLTALGEEKMRSWSDREQSVSWETCKFAGAIEQMHGDIAVRVRVHLSDETYVDGVAFYEAKREFYEKGKPQGFDSIDKAQLDGLRSFAFGDSQMLLYQIFRNREHPDMIIGSARTVPLSFVHAHKMANYVPHRRLSNSGEFFMEVLARHLMGFHLDTRPGALTAFEAGLGRYAFVLNASLAVAPQYASRLNDRWTVPSSYVPLDTPLGQAADGEPSSTRQVDSLQMEEEAGEEADPRDDGQDGPRVGKRPGSHI